MGIAHQHVCRVVTKYEKIAGVKNPQEIINDLLLDIEKDRIL